jgi:putative transposase
MYHPSVLVGAVETRLVEIIGEICGDHGADVIKVETMPYHVHLLVEVAPVVSMSTFIETLKGRSCRLLRSELPRLRRLPSLRTPSWFLSTLRGALLEVVRRLVDNHKRAA